MEALDIQIILLLLVITPAILVFSAKPDSSLAWRNGRLILAIFLGYILINLSLHIPRENRLKEYKACQSNFSDGAVQHHLECGEINIADGASNVFFALLGWIPVTLYTAILEISWLLYYIKRINFKKDLRNNIFGYFIVSLTPFLILIHIYPEVIFIIFF